MRFWKSVHGINMYIYCWIRKENNACIIIQYNFKQHFFNIFFSEMFSVMCFKLNTYQLVSLAWSFCVHCVI